MNGFTQSYNRHISRIEKILAAKRFNYMDVAKLERSVFINAKKDNTFLWVTIVDMLDFGCAADLVKYRVRAKSETEKEERLLYEGSSWEETIRRIKRFAPEKAA